MLRFLDIPVEYGERNCQAIEASLLPARRERLRALVNVIRSDNYWPLLARLPAATPQC